MADPYIVTIPAFSFKGVIQESPTYIGDVCWKFELRENVLKLKASKYQADIMIIALLLDQIGYVKVVTIL